MNFVFPDFVKTIKSAEDNTIVKAYMKPFTIMSNIKIKTINNMYNKFGENKKVAAVYLLMTDVFLNSLMLSAYYHKLSQLRLDSVDIRVGDYTHCLKTAFRNAKVNAPFAVAGYTEESSKYAAMKTGCLKEYLKVFIVFESMSYLARGMKIDNLVAEKLPGIDRFLAAEIKDNIALKDVSMISKKIGIPYETKPKEGIFVVYNYKRDTFLKISLIGRALANIAHIIFAALHKAGLSYVSVVAHMLYNAIFGEAINCIARSIFRKNLYKQIKVVKVRV